MSVSAQVPYRTTFFRLVGFLRPYRWSMVVSTVLAVLSQLAAIALVLVTGNVIDEAVKPRGRAAGCGSYVGLIVAIGLVKALLMVGRRFISGRQALGVEFDLRNGLYAHLLRLSFGFYDRHQTGQLMSRATLDLQTVRFFLGYGLIFFFQHILTIVGVTAVMLWLEWRLALVALAVTPLVVVLAYRYSRVSHPVLREVQQKMADVTTVAEEAIVGVHVVKAFAQEERQQSLFERRSEAVFDQSLRANRQRALYVPVLAFVPLLAQAAVLLVGGNMVANGSLTLGTFIEFNLFVVMLIMPLRMLGMWIGQAQRATASGERIFEVLDEPEEIADRPGAIELPPGEGRIRFERVSFEYGEGRPVLDGVDLELEPGTHGRADRPHRLGQDDARVARPALLRRDRRPRARRRRRRARRDPHVAPPGDRDRGAGPVPLLGDGAREHRLRTRRTRRTRRSSGRPGSRRRTTSSSGSRTGTRP